MKRPRNVLMQWDGRHHLNICKKILIEKKLWHRISRQLLLIQEKLNHQNVPFWPDYVLSKHLRTFQKRISTEKALEVIKYCEKKFSQITMLIHVFEGKREWKLRRVREQHRMQLS